MVICFNVYAKISILLHTGGNKNKKFRKKFAKYLAEQKEMHTFAIAFEKYGSVAQLNRASDYGSEGCRFESCRSHKKRLSVFQITFFCFYYVPFFILLYTTPDIIIYHALILSKQMHSPSKTVVSAPRPPATNICYHHGGRGTEAPVLLIYALQ